ncbi:hypothetical protein OSB04_024530 [Centaurea solstitialis]|uniref:Zinc finger PMZ-type domain-containing protein n=1 Tax=Centaurea solstitialis TaxID=347529 RepID=A0AA38T5S7_9ASTR|nr:hypothetical protein OSB04_024530 [Centaurea solstitialis]
MHIVDFVDNDEFLVYELNAMMKEIGYTDDVATFFQFKIPGSDLDFGLRALGNDMDVLNLLKYAPKKECKVIEGLHLRRGSFNEDDFDDFFNDTAATVNEQQQQQQPHTDDFDDHIYGIAAIVFGTKGGINQMIDTHAIETRRQIVLMKNDASRIKAVCLGTILETPISVSKPEEVRACTGAHNWLKQINPKHWSKSHFTRRCHNDVLLNNMCEVFNKQLVDGRDKPVITALEYIKQYLMKRIVTVQKRPCVVDMRLKTCACRSWELTGIPCKHDVASIWNMAVNGLDNGIAENWVRPVYWLQTWKAMYYFKISPINGRKLLPKSGCPITITAPKHCTQVGRPKKKEEEKCR